MCWHFLISWQVVTRVSGIEYRYTEWPAFNTLPDPSQRHQPNWNELVGAELYNHADDPGEIHNAWATASTELRRELASILHAGPAAL